MSTQLILHLLEDSLCIREDQSNVDIFFPPATPWVLLSETIPAISRHDARLAMTYLTNRYSQLAPSLRCYMCHKPVHKVNVYLPLHVWTTSDRETATRVEGWAIDTCQGVVCSFNAKGFVQPLYEAAQARIKHEGKYDTCVRLE